jgi:glutathione S-transferase
MCAAKKLELLPTLDLMNNQLEATQGYLLGSTFTLADLTFLPYFALFEPAGLSDALAVCSS